MSDEEEKLERLPLSDGLARYSDVQMANRLIKFESFKNLTKNQFFHLCTVLTHLETLVFSYLESIHRNDTEQFKDGIEIIREEYGPTINQLIDEIAQEIKDARNRH